MDTMREWLENCHVDFAEDDESNIVQFGDDTNGIEDKSDNVDKGELTDTKVPVFRHLHMIVTRYSIWGFVSLLAMTPVGVPMLLFVCLAIPVVCYVTDSNVYYHL